MRRTNQLSEKPQIRLKKLLYILFTVLLFTVLSCSKNETEISDESISVANLSTSKGIVNTPAESGAFIVRYPYEGAIAITLADKRSNMTAIVGYSNLIPRYCNGDGLPEGISSIQDILNGSKGQRIIELLQGELSVHILGEYREFNDLASWCPIFNEAPLLAKGTATVISTTNDVYGSDFNITNTWSIEMHGQLLSPENEVKKFNARVLFAWHKGEEYYSLLDALVNVSIKLQ